MLKELEKKLKIKEYIYLIDEIKVKKEIIKEIDNLFFYNSQIIMQEKNINKKENDYVLNSEEIIKENTLEKNKDIKDIYREIVKLTHPDKLIDEMTDEEDIFIEATSYYKTDNIKGLISIILNIKPSAWKDEWLPIIEDGINESKAYLSLMEESFSWQWYYEKDLDKKKKIMNKFIKNYSNDV